MAPRPNHSEPKPSFLASLQWGWAGKHHVEIMIRPSRELAAVKDFATSHCMFVRESFS